MAQDGKGIPAGTAQMPSAQNINRKPLFRQVIERLTRYLFMGCLMKLFALP
jgi:hypothetical protein